MSEEKTIFKRIIDKQIPADIVYEDDRCLAFNDINPQAPTHVLVIPKKQIASLDEVTPQDAALIGHLFVVVRQIAQEKGLQRGYRTVINNGRDAGQEVPHLHVHLLAGRPMAWPPG